MALDLLVDETGYGSRRLIATIDLFWIPLGSGQRVVRTSGKAFEAISALIQGRPSYDLYHSALAVTVPEGYFAIEMTPAVDRDRQEHGVVAEGPVGTRWAGRFRSFRYEIRRWPGGIIPDAAEAVATVRMNVDVASARRLLNLVPFVPIAVWGRDELDAGDMWNSNSVISWLLTGAGIDAARIEPPQGGRAPGWRSGLVAAAHGHQSIPDPAKPAVPADATRATDREWLHLIGNVVHDLPVFCTAPLYRRWHRHWGATPEEIAEHLPGDEILPDSQFRTTRAITIDAPPEAVWPWLVQVGCLRAGWYSNDLLDNLGHPSASVLVPSLQNLEIGQWVPMSPTPSERTALKVHSFEANQWLLWAKSDCTWEWQLTPTEHAGTRLVTRIHAVYDWHHPLTALMGMVLMEFGDFAMQRRMLRGIKARAESQQHPAGPRADAESRQWRRVAAYSRQRRGPQTS